jgi:PhzF family phenazine biosynthesis protein
MAAFARWTNLVETTFLLSPTEPSADYRLRIFTTRRELPFAGHPTLGSARAWLEAGGIPASDDHLVQRCGGGLVRIRRSGRRLAFAAPPLLRGAPVDPPDVQQIAAALGLRDDQVVDAQ